MVTAGARPAGRSHEAVQESQSVDVTSGPYLPSSRSLELPEENVPGIVIELGLLRSVDDLEAGEDFDPLTEGGKRAASDKEVARATGQQARA